MLHEIHIGKLIRDKLKKDGRRVEWLSDKLCCERDSIYKLFNKKSTDTTKLLTVSLALKINFFIHLSEMYHNLTDEVYNLDHEHFKIFRDGVKIGMLIKRKFDEDGRKVEWLAKNLKCKKRNIYDIFNRHSICIELLMRISLALKVNFFAYLSEYYRKKMSASML